MYRTTRIAAALIAIVALGLSGCYKTQETDASKKEAEQPAGVINDEPEDRYQMALLETKLPSIEWLASQLIMRKTYRGAEMEDVVFNREMRNLRDFIFANGANPHPTLSTFEWNTDKGWVFGIKLGNGPKRIAFISHLDTVPADRKAVWKPFQPRIEKRKLDGQVLDFLVGRGAVDDKGPAAALITVAQALAERFDGTDLLKGWTIEFIFDTSEETDMSVHRFYEDREASGGQPDEGLIMDANWCVFAEKGIEWPVFTIPLKTKQSGNCWISKIQTPDGPPNKIPNEAMLEITCKEVSADQKLSPHLVDLYEQAVFDDPNYRKAELRVLPTYPPTGPELKPPPRNYVSYGYGNDGYTMSITALVAGAQHGSVPHLNRQNGANPLVSMLNFADWLVTYGHIRANDLSFMTYFVSSYWGTDPFGKHELIAHDSVFRKGNGTTYALTRFYTHEDKAELKMDIRYATPHHSLQWREGEFGLLDGDSRFDQIFRELTTRFNSREGPLSDVSFETKTLWGPDLKDVNSLVFAALHNAYGAVYDTGSNVTILKPNQCPLTAIGGGTDAHGHDNLVAAGPLHNIEGVDTMGPPINYHGKDEAVPVKWLHDAARVYYRYALERVLPPY